MEKEKVVADNYGQYSMSAPLLEDDISLTEIWRIILRQKKVMVGIWGLAVLFAVGYLAVAEPIYESKAVVQIGRIGQIDHTGKIKIALIEPIEDSTALVERIERGHKIIDAQPDYPHIKVSTNKNDLIAINVKDRTKLGAKQYLEQAVNRLVSEHEVLYNTVFNLQRERYESLMGNIGALERQTTLLSTLIEGFKDKEPLQAALLNIERGKLSIDIWNLKGTAVNMKLAMGENQWRQTKVIGEPTVSGKPFKPKPKRVIAISVLLGLILGIFSTFIAEFITKFREQSDPVGDT